MTSYIKGIVQRHAHAICFVYVMEGGSIYLTCWSRFLRGRIWSRRNTIWCCWGGVHCQIKGWRRESAKATSIVDQPLGGINHSIEEVSKDKHWAHCAVFNIPKHCINAYTLALEAYVKLLCANKSGWEGATEDRLVRSASLAGPKPDDATVLMFLAKLHWYVRLFDVMLSLALT